jgi:hypothetical protein
MAVEVKVRYLGHDIAKHFGSGKRRETVHLPDKAEYEHLLSLLEKRFDRAFEELYGRKPTEKMLETFIFIREGQNLQTIRDKSINPDSEVLVAYADLGG